MLTPGLIVVSLWHQGLSASSRMWNLMNVTIHVFAGHMNNDRCSFSLSPRVL